MSKTERRTFLLVLLTSLSTTSLIASNLLAIKLFDFCGTAVDCGILLYPVSYIIGDLSVAYYGERLADRIVLISAAANLLAVVLFQLAIFLPPYPGWEGQSAFAGIFGFALRTTCASVLAYTFSGIVNNTLFEKLRHRGFATSALGSSALAHLVDSAIFETVAFFGLLPFDEFLRQASFAYLAAFGAEAVLFLCLTQPISLRVAHWLERD